MIAETTVQHVTIDDMLDADNASHADILNTYINEQLDDKTIRIQHREGGFNLEDEYDSTNMGSSLRVQ